MARIFKVFVFFVEKTQTSDLGSLVWHLVMSLLVFMVFREVGIFFSWDSRFHQG